MNFRQKDYKDKPSVQTVQKVLDHFFRETTLHGFKRFWLEGPFRSPVWLMLIIVGFAISVYQINDKARILFAMPLSVNINLQYKNELRFPAVTVCSNVKVRISFLVNSSLLMNAINVMYPTYRKNSALTEKDTKLLNELDSVWTTKEFFRQAGIPKEQLILWCRLPNGMVCSSDDFELVMTDDGFCFKLSKGFKIREAGPRSALKLLLNTAYYEVVPNATKGGVKILIHGRDETPMTSFAYNLMPGYQTSVLIRKTITKQLERCENSNPLNYCAKYSHSACQIERKMVDVSLKCNCKLYTMPHLVNKRTKNTTIDDLEDCSLSQHFLCVRSVLPDYYLDATTLHTSENTVTEPRRSFDSKCIGECVKHGYEKEQFHKVFKDASAFRNMIGEKAKIISEAYQNGLDADALLKFFLKTDDDYRSLWDVSKGIQDLIYKKHLVPPYGTVAGLLLEKLSCLRDMMKLYGNDTAEIKASIKQTNNTLSGAIRNAIVDLDPKLEALDIGDIIDTANSLKQVHLLTCSKNNQEICTLGALYNLLKLRSRLEKKHAQSETLLNESVKNLAHQIEIFVGQNGTLHTFSKQTSDDDKRLLKQMLQYYITQVTFCLKETTRTYEKILNDGQPSMKTASDYNNFLSDLNYLNVILFRTCKKGGFVVDTLFDVSDRKELAFKIIHIITHGETELRHKVKVLQFKEALIEFVGGLERKLLPSSYDTRLLNTSLYDISSLEILLNKYLHESNKDRFKKSSLYNVLHATNFLFRDGVAHYKSIVINHIRGLENFMDTSLEKLMAAYPGPAEDLHDVTDFEFPLSVEHIMCLKGTKSILNDIEKSDLDAEALSTYANAVSELVHNLKLYVEDIRSLKKFYNENLGLVQIYFQDMAVKESVQEQAYDLLSFFCDIGGIIGLWLGGSMLSFFEIFDLLFLEHVKTFYFCCKTCKKTPKNRVENSDMLTNLPENQEAKSLLFDGQENGDCKFENNE